MPGVTLATSAKQPQLTSSDDVLRVALSTRGVVVDSAVWDDIAPDDRIVCVRSTWDYHLRAGEFRAWVSQWVSRPGRFWNAPETILWNIDKVYLRDLSDRGIAIPPTSFHEPGTSPDLSTIQRPVVVKPRVSATALGTHLIAEPRALTPDENAQLISSGAIVQDFLPEVATEGELSLMFFAGRYSHAVRKRAAAGDFRVQADFGGTVSVHASTPAELAFAHRVLDAVTTAWIYARVDIVATAAGLVLMELELIEPELFLTGAPAAAAAFAEALARRARAIA